MAVNCQERKNEFLFFHHKLKNVNFMLDLQVRYVLTLGEFELSGNKHWKIRDAGKHQDI